MKRTSDRQELARCRMNSFTDMSFQRRSLMLVRYVALAAALVLVACGPEPQPLFEKEGVSASQLNRDRGECQKEYAGFAPMSKVIKCMEARGYKQVGWM